jgi:hypothetical protein
MKKRSSNDPATTYDVGYGKPPKTNQFRKGRTGNPRGRKRGDENIISAFKRVVLRRVMLNDGERSRKITLAEAVILKNYNAALQRDAFAMGNVFRLAEASGELIDRSDPKQVGKPLLVPEKVTIEEFLARFGRTVETE